jgi:hypothetical protein
MNLRELRAELRKLRLPTGGVKQELKLRLKAAQNTVFDKDAASSIEGFQDEKIVSGRQN